MLVVTTISSVNGAGVVALQNFSHYEVILQRRPFGDAAPTAAELAAANRPVVPAGPSYIDSLRLCAITDADGAIRVGFVDIKAKPPKTYFLFVGQSEDGIEVVDADYENESVILSKGGEERGLTMAGATALASSSAAPATSRSAGSRRRRARITRTREEIAEMRRLEIERKKPILEGAEYEEHIRQYNLNEIRMGGIPLPVALSAADDAMLVEEGILAPME